MIWTKKMTSSEKQVQGQGREKKIWRAVDDKEEQRAIRADEKKINTLFIIDSDPATGPTSG